MSHWTCWLEAEKHAAEAGERAAEHPDDAG